jgi:tetratricopeptide (TPR) repeat protein
MRIILTVFCLGALAFGQAHHHAAAADNIAVDLAKLPAPQHLDGIGHSHLSITTKSPEAQQWFDQGLALMHCFWDYEALRAFQQAVRLDADCAMCHWGVAQALDFRGGAKDQAREEMKKAEELAPKVSDHEQRYIRAFAASSKKDNDEETFKKEMELLIDRYRDDLEARLFYAGSVGSGYDKDGEPRTGTLYGQTLLREILQQHPDNAAANHYWIHAVESSDHPEWALDAAKKLGSLAPSSGHMVHMPGHIFYRVGDYERARQIFLDSMRVDREYMDRQHVSVANDWNYSHNISYLIADCAEEGRYAEAREHAKTLKGIANDPENSGNVNFYVFQIGATEERLAIRFGDWGEVAKHPLDFGVPDEKLGVWERGYRDGLLHYAAGMKAAETGSVDEAQRESDQLDALLWRLSKEDLEDPAKGSRDRAVNLLSTASMELRGDIATRKGDLDGGRKLLEQAADAERDLGYSEPPQYSRPPLEVLGGALIRAGKFDDARAAYKKDLHERPRSGFALYGIALAWDKQGNRGKAAKAYREFLEAWSHADPDLPQLRAAKAYLANATDMLGSGTP